MSWTDDFWRMRMLLWYNRFCGLVCQSSYFSRPGYQKSQARRRRRRRRGTSEAIRMGREGECQTFVVAFVVDFDVAVLDWELEEEWVNAVFVC